MLIMSDKVLRGKQRLLSAFLISILVGGLRLEAHSFIETQLTSMLPPFDYFEHRRAWYAVHSASYHLVY